MVNDWVYKGRQWEMCVHNPHLEMEICDKGKEKIGFQQNPNYLTQSIFFCKWNQVYRQALFDADNSVMFRLNDWKISFCTTDYAESSH